MKIKLLPYFILAVSIIAAYLLLSEFGAFLAVLRKIWSVITPFFYGFLMAYIINIPCSAIQRALAKGKWQFVSKRSKGLGLVITFILIILLITLVLYLIIPALYRSIMYFISNLPVYYEGLLLAFDYVNNFVYEHLNIRMDGTLLSFLQDIIQNLNIDMLLSPINALFAVPSAIFTTFLATVSSIYILIEKDKFIVYMCRLLKAFSSELVYEKALKYGGRLNGNFKRYIRVQTMDGLILGTIATIELTIIGSPFALLLGIMLGIVNYIPYFGSIIGSIIAVLVVAFTQGLTMGVIAAIVLLVTQQIDGNIIQPKLMGSSFSFSPLLVIVSVTVGGAFWGVLGMIAAIPMVAILKDVLESVTAYYERKKLSNEDANEDTDSQRQPPPDG